jgi:adenosylhomocysteine nucleosidase
VVSSWLPRTVEAFQQDNKIALVAGMGPKHAAVAARAVIEEFSPQLIVSAGFAGAIDDKLGPAAMLRPTRVVNAATGQVYVIDGSGEVIIASSNHVVDKGGKRELARRYSAVAVDMEGATIAEIAHAARIPFAGVKVISEPADFPMPPFDRFIGDDGRLRTGPFLAFAAVHPTCWAPLVRLARDSARAADVLAKELSRL